MTKEEMLKAIKGLSYVEIMYLWNEYADKNGMADKKVYKNTLDFLDEAFTCPSDAVLAVTCGKYKEGDVYTTFDSLGNLVTFMFWDDEDSPIDANIIADWLLDNPMKAAEYGIEDEILY